MLTPQQEVNDIIKGMVQSAVSDYLATRNLLDPEYMQPLINTIRQVVSQEMAAHRAQVANDLEYRIKDIIKQQVRDLGNKLKDTF